MTKMIEITEAEFNAIRAKTTSVHMYMEGNLTYTQYYAVPTRTQPPVSSCWKKYNRSTGKRTYFKAA